MSEPREALARIILINSMCPGQEYLATRLADAILAEFLVVPRSDIVGTEYGWRAEAGWPVPHPRNKREWALLTARKRGGEAVARPALPWSVIPLSECGAVATDGAHAWQADIDIDTPPGVVACAVCPAMTAWPLPEDGEK